MNQGSQFRTKGCFNLARGTKYSVLIDTGVPFQDYYYLYISIHKYIFVLFM